MPTLQENMEPEDIEPIEKNLVPLPEDTLYEERPRLTLDQIREFAKQGSGKTLENLWESQEKKVILEWLQSKIIWQDTACEEIADVLDTALNNPLEKNDVSES